MKYGLVVIGALLLSAAAPAQDYPAPIKALAAKGFTVRSEMPAPPGYRGFVADYHGRPVPLYLMPDGQHVSLGNLFDAQGNDLTSDVFHKAIVPRLDNATWDRLARSTWVAEGARKPQRVVYVFTDSECPYCHKLWQATQPLLEHGNVQVRNIIVAVISPRSAARGAAILNADDPGAALRRHERNPRHSPIKPLAKVSRAIRDKLAANESLMNSLGIFGTPGIVFRDASGKIHIANGMQRAQIIEAVFGTPAK